MRIYTNNERTKVIAMREFVRVTIINNDLSTSEKQTMQEMTPEEFDEMVEKEGLKRARLM